MQVKFDEFYGEKIIPASDSVRLINRIVEEMDIISLLIDKRKKKSRSNF